jgi:hypothetical protein
VAGKPVTRFSDDDIRVAVRMVDAGFSWEEAARRYGMGTMTLHRRARKLDIGRRGKKPAAYEQRVNLPTSLEDIVYLAALIDCEGHITIYRGTRDAACVGVTNTDEALMQWLTSIGGSIHEKRVAVGRKPCWGWQLQGRRDVLAFLDVVAPYMRIKRAKAEEAMDFLRARGVMLSNEVAAAG